MPNYKTPLDDMRFVLNEVLNIGSLAKFDNFKDAEFSVEMSNQFLAEVAKFSEDVLFPLNIIGDTEGCTYSAADKKVKTPTGFKEAYKQFCELGLSGISCNPKYEGMGMPQVMNTALSEIFCSSNMSFAMYPGLTHGAYNALHEYGTDKLKDIYLPKFVSGQWGGTMCLTEPQCGTDLGLIKTKAVKQDDGSYKITGTKIFISSGEHDLTENICHLVLARVDDSSTPKGIKGISLFIVPKIKPLESGELGEANSLYCGAIEEKMGIHGNSTCEIVFEEASGHLVGDLHKGMKAMFIMMNEARLGVGLQGLALSEVSYQNAVTYALERIQSPRIDKKSSEEVKSATIINHPDVRREILTIKSAVEGGRMLAYWLSMQLDISQRSKDKEEQQSAQKIVDLLTPVVKAHLTDNAVENTNSAMQVYGGHGYIKEHGMEQYNRDARITRIYEGTNGIQALDLIGRKVMYQNLLPHYLKLLKRDLKRASSNGVSSEFIKPVKVAAKKIKAATRRLQLKGFIAKMRGNLGLAMCDIAGVSTDYLKLLSLVSMGHMWVRMVEKAELHLKENQDGKEFYETKIKTARFYMEKIMPQSLALEIAIKNGASTLMDISESDFEHRQTNIAEDIAPLSENEN